MYVGPEGTAPTLMRVHVYQNMRPCVHKQTMGSYMSFNMSCAQDTLTWSVYYACPLFPSRTVRQYRGTSSVVLPTLRNRTHTGHTTAITYMCPPFAIQTIGRGPAHNHDFRHNVVWYMMREWVIVATQQPVGLDTIPILGVLGNAARVQRCCCRELCTCAC